MTKLPASVDQRSDSPSSTAMQRAIRLLVPVLITLGMGSVLLWFARDAGVRSVTFTFWANFFVLAWANGVQRVTRLSLGERYYRCKRFEQDGRFYEWLGIRFCKRLLSSRVWRAFNPGFQFNQQGSRMLPALAQALRDVETGHSLGFLGMSMLAGYAVSQRWWDTAGWLFLFNVFINGYPIMLQRYNRARWNISNDAGGANARGLAWCYSGACLCGGGWADEANWSDDQRPWELRVRGAE